MGKTAGIFTLRAQLIPLGNLFSDPESPSEQCSVSVVSFDVGKSEIFVKKKINHLDNSLFKSDLKLHHLIPQWIHILLFTFVLLVKVG